MPGRGYCLIDFFRTAIVLVANLSTQLAAPLAMPIRPEHNPSPALLRFLVRCYRFVAQEWPRADRIQVPDEGFEQRFRESCFRELNDWTISDEREFNLGIGIGTASGVVHEVDIIANHPELMAIVELKNRSGALPGKNDIIVFFAKVLDYLAANPEVLSSDVCLAFMSRSSFDSSGLSACLGLGIHPIATDIRPLPILIDNAKRLEVELNRGLPASRELLDRVDDFVAELNRIAVGLTDTWLDNRCGYLSATSLVLNAVNPPNTIGLSQQLRHINNEYLGISNTFSKLKTATSQ